MAPLTPSNPPRERAVEAYLLEQCRAHGLLCMKFTSPARSGVPDRIVISPVGTMFVEVKRPGERLRKLQRVTHAKMRRAGARIHVVDSEAGVDAFLASVLDELDDEHPAQKEAS